jgi:hypothetical protein
MNSESLISQGRRREANLFAFPIMHSGMKTKIKMEIKLHAFITSALGGY